MFREYVSCDIGFYADPKQVTVSFSNDQAGPILTLNVPSPKRKGLFLNVYFPVCWKNQSFDHFHFINQAYFWNLLHL